MTDPRPCPAAQLTALVDGELGHQARERLQRHLVGCADCRAERGARADLKALLRAAPTPPVSDQLTARLLGIEIPGAAARTPPTTGSRPVPAGPPAARSAGLRPTAGRPPGRHPTFRRGLTGRQRLGLGGALVVLSFSAAFALGAPRTQAPLLRLDPSTDVFLADYAGVTGDRPVQVGVAGVRSPDR